MMLKVKPAIEVSPLAIKKIVEVLKQYSYPLYVRIYMQGTGCTGYKLNMALDRNKDTDDVVYPQKGFEIVVDPTTNQYIPGTKIDYDESENSFIIDSPTINELNEDSSCAACGLSCGPNGCSI